MSKSVDELTIIQHLQFSDLAQAELLLTRWFALHMHLQVERITLTPKAVSLNSFNGIYRLHGQDYFFKTHVEEQSAMKTEYYHAEMLRAAGYNVVEPLYIMQEQGRQMVIYPVVHDPVMFDLMREVETGAETFATITMLAAAEKLECERLLSIYQATLACSSAKDHAIAPIHQLFWHRLTGGRLAHFYAGKHVLLPGNPQKSGASILFEDLLHYRWCINGKMITSAHETLGASIERAKMVLHPEREAPTVIGHGDAHFGNVFMTREGTYRYFDPAFAGRHSVLLDIIKPLYHNIFATWMYFPKEVARDLQLTVELRDGCVFVEHTYVLTPVRRAILETKLEYFLQPLKAWLRSLNALPDDWQEVINLALMCCPLLTLNLLDIRFSATLTWLGLSQAMEMSNFFLQKDVERSF